MLKYHIYKNSIFFAFLWAFIIFILCATPGYLIPTTNWLELLSFDKWVHASMFFILCNLFFLTALKNKRTIFWLFFYFFICISYGGLLELMQAKCFSNRSADWLDFIANTFGCVVALLLFKSLKKVFINEETNAGG